MENQNVDNMIIKNEPMLNGSISVTKEFGTNVANQESSRTGRI